MPDTLFSQHDCGHCHYWRRPTAYPTFAHHCANVNMETYLLITQPGDGETCEGFTER